MAVQFHQAQYPPGGIAPVFHEMTISVGANPQNPFEEAETTIREWFADHSDREDVMGVDYTGDLRSLGPNHLLECQTDLFCPRRWLLLKILLQGTEDWVGLVVRGDTGYTIGFFNKFGRYQIPEPKSKKDLLVKVTYLPGDEYKVLEDDWNLNYSSFLACDQAVILERLLELILPEGFVAETITYLSNLNPIIAAGASPEEIKAAANANKEGKRRLGALIFRLIEFIRMLLSLADKNLLKIVQAYAPLCSALRVWKYSGYKSWDPNNRLQASGILTLRQALSTCKLCLNYGIKAKEAWAKKKQKAGGPGSSGKDGPVGGSKDEIPKPGGSGKDGPVGGSKDETPKTGGSGKDEASSSGSKDQTEGIEAGCGERQIQVLGVEANYRIVGINLFDFYGGQTIFSRQGGQGDLPKYYVDPVYWPAPALNLIGPSRPISAEGLVGAEIFQSKSENGLELKAERVQWTLSDMKEGFNVLYHANDEQYLQIMCYLIENPVEARLNVKVRFEGTSGEEAGVVTILGKCRSIETEVYLIRDHILDKCSCEWSNLPLDVSILSLFDPGELEVLVVVETKSNFLEKAVSFAVGGTQQLQIGQYEFEIDANM